jgi:hypothetical protein
MSEGKVAEWLASLGNLPEGDLKGAIKILLDCVWEQQKQIEELQNQVDDLPETYELIQKKLPDSELELIAEEERNQ